jgi:hypothetical protein
MKESEAFEAELLVEVQRARIAFGRCQEYGSVSACREPARQRYSNALRAFSGLILDGKTPEELELPTSHSELRYARGNYEFHPEN